MHDRFHFETRLVLISTLGKESLLSLDTNRQYSIHQYKTNKQNKQRIQYSTVLYYPYCTVQYSTVALQYYCTVPYMSASRLAVKAVKNQFDWYVRLVQP